MSRARALSGEQQAIARPYSRWLLVGILLDPAEGIAAAKASRSGATSYRPPRDLPGETDQTRERGWWMATTPRGITLRYPGAVEVEHRHLLAWTALAGHARTLPTPTRRALTDAIATYRVATRAGDWAGAGAHVDAALDACLPLATPHPPPGTAVQLDALDALTDLTHLPT